MLSYEQKMKNREKTIEEINTVLELYKKGIDVYEISKIMGWQRTRAFDLIKDRPEFKRSLNYRQ